jgi:dipeptide transport system substrate-binding protein
MNADDVIFSLERQWKSENPFHFISGGDYSYFQDLGFSQLLRSIEKLDDYTVRIRLNRPEAPFLADLAMPFSAIQSAEYADQLLQAGMPEKFDEEPIGTGPFSFVGYKRHVAIRYHAFAHYWAGPPAFDDLVFSITPTASVRLVKLKSGECQVAALPSPTDRDKIEAEPELRLLHRPGFSVSYLALTTTRPPFDDVRVRRAINMAIDKSAIIEAVYKGAGIPAANAIPPTIWSYNRNLDSYPFDPEAAQRLLMEAGVQTVDVDLWYFPMSQSFDPKPKLVAEMIRADLANIGLRVHLIEAGEWRQFRERLLGNAVSMTLHGWTGDSGDPDNFLYLLLGCPAGRPGDNNLARWCNQQYDDLVGKAKLTTDYATRKELYERAQAIFHEDAPWVPLAHSEVLTAIRAGVAGLQVDPLGRQLFDRVQF